MRKFLSALTLSVACLVIGVLAPSAMAGGEIYTSPGGCQSQPATWVPGTTVSAAAGSHSESSSEASSFSVAETKKVIKIWEHTNKRHVAVRMKPNGIKGSRDCMDPVKQHLIKPGDLFKNNSLAGGSPFWDV